MTAFFNGKTIHHVIVQGNGESVYYALQESKIKTDSSVIKVVFTTGVNKIICSNMKINFTKGKLNDITFYKMPDASFIPPHEWKKDELKLKGFTWRGDDRPKREDVVQKQLPDLP